MTTKPPIQTTGQTTGQTAGRFRLPDPPPREPDEVTAFDHIYKHANNRYLAIHFGNPETTLVEYDRWIIASPEYNRSRARRPDLLIAFDVSAEIYKANNGYVVSEQGKPPDFVIEVASESTADVDTGIKREHYAELGIPEYWRFDETGKFHQTRLAGDRLVGGHYEPIPIDEPAPGILQGYSAVLNLIIRWDHGTLVWWDPATEAPLPTFEQEREGRLAAQEERRAEQEGRLAEREARLMAEARVRELEAEIARRDEAT